MSWILLDDERWRQRFQADFQFRPGTTVSSWPAIREPAGAVTIDLAPIFTAAGRGADDLDTQVLAAMIEAFPGGTGLAALDWFHSGFWFVPAHGELPPVRPFPNGDYHIFLTEDLTSGLFGHPWEQTLCVFGAGLVAALVPELTRWLPVKRDKRAAPVNE
ncbi:DUF2716 domain-containing protein [Fodinicola feengrottensis]|uniref:DUF2716 domain-containing protein n=1 Tax=Fodinicola feengrottensis TaxID=435914 RepID=A0ABP4RTW4_9ACTN|nr:DUF2716 domain-containing protein [Fodinicola feengrottensis]